MAVETTQITVNGKTEDVPRDLTLAHYLARRGVPTALVAVEYNGRILQRAEFDQLVLTAGDTLEIVHFVGGG